jgi:rare lipoprotein A
MASYYANKHVGKKTASGEAYRSNKLTAAHKTLPFGTSVKVTNLSNGKSVVVRINDRGPFIRGRIIDLSKAAARKIDMIKAGVTKVRIEYKKA